MIFRHDSLLWEEFPTLTAGVLLVDGVDDLAEVDHELRPYLKLAAARLAETPESQLPSIQAWRQVYSRMGLKPTQYRSAAESLLRRLRRTGGLPRLHPLVDLCNALSAAYAIPVAVFDRDEVDGDLVVRHATGSETYRTFGDEQEEPVPGEVIFADSSANAHARRWVHRQSGLSAVGPNTQRVLIVAEAHHASAVEDVPTLIEELAAAIKRCWPAAGTASRVVTADDPAVTTTTNAPNQDAD